MKNLNLIVETRSLTKYYRRLPALGLRAGKLYADVSASLYLPPTVNLFALMICLGGTLGLGSCVVVLFVIGIACYVAGAFVFSRREIPALL